MKDLHRSALVIVALVTVAALTVARASDEQTVALANTLTRIETALDNRIGVFVLDTDDGRLFGYRADERFATASRVQDPAGRAYPA